MTCFPSLRHIISFLWAVTWLGPYPFHGGSRCYSYASQLQPLYAFRTCCLHHSPGALLNPYRLAHAISGPGRLHTLKERDMFHLAPRSLMSFSRPGGRTLPGVWPRCAQPLQGARHELGMRVADYMVSWRPGPRKPPPIALPLFQRYYCHFHPLQTF